MANSHLGVFVFVKYNFNIICLDSIMIQYVDFNLLDLKSNFILAHGVNCQGKMGAGIAKSIRDKYPKVYDSYMDRLSVNGASQSHQTSQFVLVNEDSFVVNLFSQFYYGRKEGVIYADNESIERSVLDMFRKIEEFKLTQPIYMSKIGCSNGGNTWENNVESIIEEISNRHDKTVYVST